MMMGLLVREREKHDRMMSEIEFGCIFKRLNRLVAVPPASPTTACTFFSRSFSHNIQLTYRIGNADINRMQCNAQPGDSVNVFDERYARRNDDDDAAADDDDALLMERR